MTAIGYGDIVTNLKGPILVLAGPGAGKTYLLADKVKRLLDSGLDQRQITVLTFSKDAYQHMLNTLLDSKGEFGIKHERLPNISTMHSLGFQKVPEHG